MELPQFFLLTISFIFICIGIWLFFKIKALQPTQPLQHPHKKKFNRCTDFRVIRKEIWRAFQKHYKPLIIQASSLQRRKKELNDRMMKGENCQAEIDQLKQDIQKWSNRRDGAAEHVFKKANSFIPVQDKMDLHGLFVGDALKIVQRKLPNLKKNKDIHTMRISCGVGNHNGLGYSKIGRALSKMLKKNNIQFWIDHKIGFVNVNMKSVPDKIEYEITTIRIEDHIDEITLKEKEINFGNEENDDNSNE
ncbi:hypothetical protein ENU1_189730 [Entamoeba nuttalli P19]|uniref:Smr domain-containing protein n=1 Tax=Entamoeba nuttalli (strain P19) TaxID=1076696 RepID=K2H5F2_ENTNP|nr:hypothetical protein ENU1_189730 [Entamoeba nuttalli P19]EKE37664.1 hypothetical protein ENU1_189730 [Entamoeba nuttalli P19]|eukprot:XP_008859986.1 hypothetical protein ENU1_189730 [Entamoeba nuttalli P19]